MPEFSTSTQPVRPGSYWDFNAVSQPPVYVNTQGIVGAGFTHNWGPANQVIVMNSMGDFLANYGQGLVLPAATVGYKAATMIFQGEGMPGRTGASQVLGYRMVNASGTSGTASLQNTTPAAALTLNAKYLGSFSANIAYTVTVDAINPTTALDLNVYVNGAIVETWVFNKTDMNGLAAQVNNAITGSDWLTATVVINGVALATVATPTALTTGNDGATLVALDYTNMFSAFAVQRFGVFVCADLEDPTISAALNSWQAGLNNAGQRFTTVVGGATGDTASTAQTRSLIFADPNVVNLGVGTYLDATLGTLNTAQLAPRLAGIIAARGDRQGLSYARLAGLTATVGAQNTDILSGIAAGFITIGRDSNALSPLRIEKGVTTYTTMTNPAMPYWCYSNPKFVLTMQQIENDLKQWANDNVIGQLPVDQNSVDYIIGYLKSYLNGLVGNNVVQDGFTVIRNPTPPPTPQDNFVAVLYGLTFMRDMEQVLNTVTVQ